MNDEQLIGELRFLGVDKDSHRVVALLPLAQVAFPAQARFRSCSRARGLLCSARPGTS